MFRNLSGPSGLAALAALLALAGCGGGLYFDYGDAEDDRAPLVSLAVSTGAAAVGQTVTLLAEATDDHRVDRVEFFRVDTNGNAVSLGSDGSAPYHFDTRQPETNAASVRYFARAIDDIGQFNDSPSVTITVLR